MNDMASIGDVEEAGARAGATPVMAQYLEIKRANPDSLLFYRMGDFYELFFRDAETAAGALGIALTKRGKHLGEDIPMCGVPVHAADGYLQRLIRQGHRVAVCEQLEDPAEARKRGSKSVVRRDVVRLVTPGTLTEDTLLDARAHNYLVAVARVRGDGGLALAWTDISSGDLAAASTDVSRLAADLARLEPREIVVADILLGEEVVSGLLEDTGAAITPLPGSRFDSVAGERRLKDYFGVATLDAFGTFNRTEVAALGGLLEYVLLTQVGKLPHLRKPRREEAGGLLLIDGATRANLELTRTLSGEKKGSLQSVVDFTTTAPGARLFSDWLANPLSEPAAIGARLDAVGYLKDDAELRRNIRLCLVELPDLERALGRLTIGRGGPRDLAAIAQGLRGAGRLAELLRNAAGFAGLPHLLEREFAVLANADAAFCQTIADTLADEVPVSARDGGFVRQGHNDDLDQNRALRDETRQVIASLQTRYAEDTGVRTLKVRHNNVLGYFVEVSSANAAALQQQPLAARFFHRQTVANAMRFVTEELSALEQRIASAAERVLAMEQEIFARLVADVVARRDHLSGIARAAAAVDVISGLAELAERRRYVRPVIDDSMAFDIRGGRHPVVEAVLEAQASSFVVNDCNLSEDGRRLWLLTGPNMSGKSTFLRQNALIAILAQMGSFVPAASAHIGVIDRLFSRVGAADDLARGRSTFMVEMVETAAILNQATPRSFVILDEIGRGTATFDGLSIAWAAVEHLHETNRCRALFATHYHELTVLAARLDHLANATVKVREWQGDVVFLHEVIPGVADRSYGIQVAKLAGLPPAVIARAAEGLKHLEEGENAQARQTLVDDLPLFQAARPEPHAFREPQQSLVEKRLEAVAPDDLSPRDALALIYELKASLPDHR